MGRRQRDGEEHKGDLTEEMRKQGFIPTCLAAKTATDNSLEYTLSFGFS